MSRTVVGGRPSSGPAEVVEAVPAQAFGCARVVWNDCLRDRRE
ncbi:helix-turn-helix domain-containing protein, partial [Streptomyces marokkonensis]